MLCNYRLAEKYYIHVCHVERSRSVEKLTITSNILILRLSLS